MRAASHGKACLSPPPMNTLLNEACPGSCPLPDTSTNSLEFSMSYTQYDHRPPSFGAIVEGRTSPDVLSDDRPIRTGWNNGNIRRKHVLVFQLHSFYPWCLLPASVTRLTSSSSTLTPKTLPTLPPGMIAHCFNLPQNYLIVYVKIQAPVI